MESGVNDTPSITPEDHTELGSLAVRVTDSPIQISVSRPAFAVISITVIFTESELKHELESVPLTT